jgi:hypothetical protein
VSPLKTVVRAGLVTSAVVELPVPGLGGLLFRPRFLFLPVPLDAPPAAAAFPFAPVRGAEVMVELLTELLMLVVSPQIFPLSPGGDSVVGDDEYLLSSDPRDCGLTSFRRYPRLSVVPDSRFPDLV